MTEEELDWEAFMVSHEEFVGHMKSGLYAAKDAGEAIIRLCESSGLTVNQLFPHVEVKCSQARKPCGKSTFYGYFNVAKRWSELEERSGGEIQNLSFRKALEMLSAPKLDLELPIKSVKKPLNLLSKKEEGEDEHEGEDEEERPARAEKVFKPNSYNITAVKIVWVTYEHLYVLAESGDVYTLTVPEEWRAGVLGGFKPVVG